MVEKYPDRVAAVEWARSVGGGRRLVGGDWIFTDQQLDRLHSDYDALAARLAKTVRLLHELGWTDEAIEREIATSDAIECVTAESSAERRESPDPSPPVHMMYCEPPQEDGTGGRCLCALAPPGLLGQLIGGLLAGYRDKDNDRAAQAFAALVMYVSTLRAQAGNPDPERFPDLPLTASSADEAQR